LVENEALDLKYEGMKQNIILLRLKMNHLKYEAFDLKYEAMKQNIILLRLKMNHLKYEKE
jgi:hypothetical protein